MRFDAPHELTRLLHAADQTARDDAWATFISAHSRLLLHVARNVASEHDASLDIYAYVLEKLREDDFRRLRNYAADGRGKFTTWLVVVTRRLCLDFQRQRYGRAPQVASSQLESDRVARRRLVDLQPTDLNLDLIAEPSGGAPDHELRKHELTAALTTAITHLPPNDRLLLKLRFEDGLGGSDIAALLHLPTAFHAYRRLNRILADLRERLRRLGVQDSAP